MITLNLLLAAVVGDESELERQLELIAQAGQIDNVPESVVVIRDCIEPWVFNRSLPPTPWIIAAELSRACRGRLVGFSKANISKEMNGELQVEEPLEPNGRYWRYRHVNPEIHRKMLSHIVAYLKNTEFFRFMFPASKSRKTTESDQ